MELVSGSHIPDGLLAAMTLLSEKPRQGVTSWESAPQPGTSFCISSTAFDFQLRCSETASDPVVAPNSDPDTERIRQLAVGINNNAGQIITPKGVAAFYGASAVGAAGAFIAADVAAGAEGSLLFGRGYYGWTGYLNGNSPWGAALRVGFGWNGTQQVFRIGGSLLNGGHIDLWPPSAW